jgi:hypothetical protein
MNVNFVGKALSGVALLGALAGFVPNASALTGTCGILGSIPHPFQTGVVGVSYNLDLLATINFSTNTINYNFTVITITLAGQTFSSNNGSASFTTAAGPLTGSTTITFPFTPPGGGAPITASLNVLPVNGGNTYLVQGNNVRMSGVCQTI